MNYSTKLYTILRGGAICKFVFALMCCVMIAMQSYGQEVEAYAVLSTDYETLTFYFDNQRANRQGTSFDLNNVGSTPKEDPQWFGVHNDDITKVVFDPSFAYYRPISCQSWFANLENLEKIEGINEYLNTSQVTSMGGMFYQCYKLSGELNLSNFDTQNVTDMSNMFAFCAALKTINISGFNTSQVTNMYWMFMNCGALETIEIGDEWNTGSVTNMSGLFGGCTNLKFDFTKLNTTSVISMDYMLRDWNTTELDLSTFETGSVTTMQGMFAGCRNLERINIDPNKFNTENVEDMGWMFSNCNKLSSRDLPKFNTNSAMKMNNMFTECTNLEILDLRSFNTEKVVDMREMFSNCENLTTILVDPKKWIINVDPNATFYYGNSEKNIPPFENTPNLIGDKGTQYKENSYDYAIANTENSYLTTYSYKIFYDLGEDGEWNGTEPQSSFDIDLKQDITITTKPTKKGYTFKGWYGTPITGLTEDNPQTDISIPAGAVGNRIYTAVWGTAEYTLSFDTNGGSTIESITQEPGAEIVPPANPTKDGYDFVRWEPELPKQMPVSDMVVKAVWAKPSVKPALNLPQTLSFPAIPQQPESFCQGDEKSAILKFTPTGITVTDYELSIADIITSDAHPAMDMTINGKDTTYTIKIDIPENQTPGVYHGTIKLFAKDNPTPYEESVTVEVAAAKDIVLYLYEDVIFVDNGKELYQKDQWQWYKNGSPIKNANYQYYFERPLNGSYMAEMKSVKDGLTVYSCPVVATVDLSKNATQPVKSYPNPAVSGQPISLYIVNYNADTDYTISLSNSNGVIVNTISHAPETSVITLPRGIYSGALISGGSKKGFKLIVR